MAGRAAAVPGRSVAQRATHRAVLAAAILAAALFLFAGGAFGALAAWPVQYLAPAAALYLASHGLRAVRLAIMAARILKLSARSGALVHLVTAPAVVIPFKLGEVVRLHQLWYLGRSLPGAVLVLVVERFFDAAMLLLLLAVVYIAQGPLGWEATLLFAATSIAVLGALAVFVLGPGVLVSLQRYMVINHRDPRMVKALGRVDGLRRLVDKGADLLRARGGTLLVLSLLIWVIEALAATVLAAGIADAASAAGLGLLADRIFAGPGGLNAGAVAVWGALGVLSVTVIWPAALWFYLPRIPNEPLRVDPAREGA